MSDNTNAASERFMRLCELLPADVHWSDPITPDIVAHIVEAARRTPAAESAVREWQPIETAPESGEFLVYMPDGEPKIQTGVWHPNVNVIGNHFLFDMWKPTHWMPLPANPTAPTTDEVPHD